MYPFFLRLDAFFILHASPYLPSCWYSHQRFTCNSICTKSHSALPVTGNRSIIAWPSIFFFSFFSLSPSTDASELVLPSWVSLSVFEIDSITQAWYLKQYIFTVEIRLTSKIDGRVIHDEFQLCRRNFDFSRILWNIQNFYLFLRRTWKCHLTQRCHISTRRPCVKEP